MTTKQLNAAKVDEFVELDRELLPFKKKIYRRDQLRKEIAARYDNEDANQSFIAEGIESAGAEVSARTNRDVFKPGALKRLAGYLEDTFFKICSVSMEDFRDNVTIDHRDRFVETKQIGYRYVNVIAVGDVGKAA